MKAFSDFEQTVENKFPIYGSQKYLEGNLAQKIWTTSFWTQDAMDGLEFLASAYVPGAAISKIGAASKIGKVSKLESLLRKASKATGLGEVDNATGLVLNTLYSTTSEAMIEGAESFKSIKEELEKRFPELGNEEIERRAGEAAKNVFGYNMLYLTAPNFLQSKWLFGKSSMDDMRRLSAAGKITKEELESNIGKGFLKGFASEGLWEENIQSAVSEYEKRLATKEAQPGDGQLKL